MSITPIITFKAGLCSLDTSKEPAKVIPRTTPGYVYLFEEDDLMQFCWRPRSAVASEPELQLSIIPNDGQFIPYKSHGTPINGRVFVLKFQSSSSRHLFWLQSKSQHPQGDPSFFSARDLKLGNIVDRLFQGESIDVDGEISFLQGDNGGDGDGDAEMEDVQPSNLPSDETRENSDSKTSDSSHSPAHGTSHSKPYHADSTSSVVERFLDSLRGESHRGSLGHQTAHRGHGQRITTLGDVLGPHTTIPFLDTAGERSMDNLLSHLPPAYTALCQMDPSDYVAEKSSNKSTSETSPPLHRLMKQQILARVLQSPQFSQSLDSLTEALRDGGLPSISEALGIPVHNGGYLRAGGGVPITGDMAIEAFLEGYKNVKKPGDGN